MTIFTAIKHPISEPPTVEQLTTLPPDVFKQWINHPLALRIGLREDILLLRKLIMEYEE